MKESYMEEEQRAIFMVSIATNLSKWYGLTNNNEKAIEIINEGIKNCKKYKLGNALPHLLYGLAWNKEQLIEKGVLPPDYMFECLTELKQAYYIASSMQLSYIEKLIAEHINSKYKEYSYVLY
jgi:AMMECR1 domain-containing protein